ncbi:MAG: glycosyltransferase [Ignavibacteria bacterium]|nr:glycosyltransferase [Ignavibacteria bacterium]HRJ86951.1 glycosyltransferase [Ignavibacteria bacterium]
MQNSPEISVIIPTLNEEKLIVKTLAQFTPQVKQKYNIEIIISDGGSSDGTLSLLNDTVDKIVHAIPGEKQNIPQGRNAGAKAASGRFLYFLNADTMFEDINSFFENTCSAFSESSIYAITCRFHVFPEDVRISDKMFHGFYNNYVRMLNMAGMGMGRGECQMVRSDIFRKVNGYNELLAAGEDYDLYRRIKKLGTGRIKFLSKVLVYESPRRYRKFGYLKVLGDWTKNSFSVFFKNKSISEVWEQVR